jgi:methyltransferase
MTPLYWILAIVALQRIAELFYAARNTRRLLAQGGIEIAAGQYPWLVILHAAWLVTMLIFIPAHTAPNWYAIAAIALLQVARIWVISTLGPYWTTRIITLPGAPLVRRGPYALIRHPNYAIVCAEIAILPLAFGAWTLALIFTIANAALLTWRIRTEERALTQRRSLR